MFMNVNFPKFKDAFISMNRKENFSYDGLKALFDYLEELEEGTGEQIELDVIALCCEYSEMTLDYALTNYNCEDLAELQDNYFVIVVDDANVIVQE